MASASPSPNSSPSAVPPTSANKTTPPPPSPSSTNSSNTPPPSSPNPSAKPPSQPVPSTRPPSPSVSPPPPSPPASPPPSASTAPAPNSTSPTPPSLSPPPPLAASPPDPSPPAKNTPPSPISPILPPPVNNSTPPSSGNPSPSQGKPPESTPSRPSPAPPPSSSKSPPSTNAAPPSKTPSTPSVPPPKSSHAPPHNASAAKSPPSFPTASPTGKTSNHRNTSANSAPSPSGGSNPGLLQVIVIIFGFVVLSLLVMAMWFVWKRKKKEARSKVGYTVPSPYASSHSSGTAILRQQSSLSQNGCGSDFVYSPSEPGGLSGSRSWFTYEELVQATNGFSAQNLLGEGGFGCVYKGFLIDGRAVAVKQLKDGGGQGEREFRAEVEIISRVHHRHLVSLVGYCICEHQRLLVYDFVPNNTLHYHLHAQNRLVMDWDTRVKVAAGAARGIAYLHEDCIFSSTYLVFIQCTFHVLKFSNVRR